MKTKLLFFIFITAQIFAQIKVIDTLNVVTMQKFKVPGSKEIVLTNIKSVKIEAELLNADMQVIRQIKEYNQDPAPSKMQDALRGKRSVLVTFSCFETLDEPGTYFVRIKINAVSETGPQAGERISRIEVKNPILAAPLNLRSEYLYNEKETFSFATLEYTDFNLYSYTIYNDNSGAVLEEGKGPIVTLDKWLSDMNLVGSKIKIVGKYNGKEFKYQKKDGTVESTQWVTSIRKLTLFKNLVLLTTESDVKSGKTQPIVVSAYNTAIFRLPYGYFSKSEVGTFVTALPILKSVNVTSDPPEFVKDYIADVPTKGAFSFVQININQDYINNLPDCGQQEVKLRVSFKTQFNETMTETYQFIILK